MIRKNKNPAVIKLKDLSKVTGHIVKAIGILNETNYSEFGDIREALCDVFDKASKMDKLLANKYIGTED